MIDFLKNFKRNYKTAPALIRWILSPGFWFYHFTRKSYGLLRPMAWLLKSPADNDKEQVCLMYCGDFREKNYLVRTAFAGKCVQAEMGRLWFWQVNRFIRSHEEEVDILIYDVPSRVSLWLGTRRCFCLPIWIEGDLDFSLIYPPSRKIKDDINRVLKSEFTFEITDDIDQVRRFYNEMYVPYAKERYEDELILGDFEDVISSAKKVEVILIKKDDTYVSGGCFFCKDGDITLKYIGINSGADKSDQVVVIQAVYYFLLNHLKDKGYKKILIGGSKPFFSDGVLIFKKKWGLCLTHCEPEYNILRLYPLKDTSGVRHFLAGNPFIFLEGKDFAGAAFIDKEGDLTKEDVKEYTRYLWPGLKRVVLHHFGGSDSAVPESIKENGIEVRSAKELFA